jgi:hypothetical protein
VSHEHELPQHADGQTQLPLVLLPPEVARQLPKIGAAQELGLTALAQVKYFEPDTFRVWYGAESDGIDLFWGLVVGRDVRLGTFTLTELGRQYGPMRLPAERDVRFTPVPLEELKSRHDGELHQLEQIALEQAWRQHEQELTDGWLEAAYEDRTGLDES